MSEKSILIIGCFDTKGEVFAFLRSQILSRGEQVLTINTGVMGSSDLFPVDFESEVVAREAGKSIGDLRLERDRGNAIEVMGKGAATLVAKLVADGKIKAAIGMGGGGGTYIALSAMQEIPLGVPKLCLTTLATKDLSRQIGNKDITLMPSIVDVAGINSISSVLIAQAAAAICAMSSIESRSVNERYGSIAISMFGNTTACVDRCTQLLEKEGYEVMAFHANGVGGRTMEALILEGCFDAVLDITTTELADELCGGVCTAGPERLRSAGKMGIPQVVVPGCMDMVNFAQLDTVPEKYRDRHLYSWAPDVTLMRTDADENRVLGEKLAKSLNTSTGTTTILLPLKGLSQIDSDGGIFYRPDVNSVLFDSIKEHASNKINVIEVDMHINDPEFAGLLVTELLRILRVDEN